MEGDLGDLWIYRSNLEKILKIIDDQITEQGYVEIRLTKEDLKELRKPRLYYIPERKYSQSQNANWIRNFLRIKRGDMRVSCDSDRRKTGSRRGKEVRLLLSAFGGLHLAIWRFRKYDHNGTNENMRGGLELMV